MQKKSKMKVAGSVCMMALLGMLTITQSGCPSAVSIENWIAVVASAVGTVAPLFGSLIGAIASLTNKGITAAQVASINSKLTAAGTDATALSAIVKALQGTPDQTTLQHINDLETSIASNLNDSLLQANGITDVATQTKVTTSIQQLMADVQAIQNAIPVAVNPKVAPTGARFKFRKAMSDQEMKQLGVKLSPKAIKSNWNKVVTAKTGNSTVDSAFSAAKVK